MGGKTIKPTNFSPDFIIHIFSHTQTKHKCFKKREKDIKDVFS